MQICGEKYIMNKNIKNQNPKQIIEEITSIKRKLLNLNFQKSTGQLEKTSEIKFNRREIAKLNSKLSKISGENDA